MVCAVRLLKLPVKLGILSWDCNRPHALADSDTVQARHLAEFGRGVLMFSIGWSSAWRNWRSMKLTVFGLGGAH